MTTLAELAQAVSISSVRTDAQPDWGQDFTGTGWKVTLRYQGRQMTVNYFMGAALTVGPTSEMVLESLLSDADTYLQSSDFADWAGEYGYDEDSRKAERTYKAVGRQTRKLQKLLGGDFEQFVTADEA